MLKIKILTAERLLEGKNVYKDHFLSFEPAHPLPINPPKQTVDRVLGITVPQSFVLHVSAPARTVTFSITAINRALYSLDTFAPSPSWVIDSNLALPLPSDKGLLQFTADFAEGGIATARKEMIEYRVNPDRAVVQLEFDEAQDIRYVQVANCLIAGIDKESSNLVEMWLQDISGL